MARFPGHTISASARLADVRPTSLVDNCVERWWNITNKTMATDQYNHARNVSGVPNAAHPCRGSDGTQLFDLGGSSISRGRTVA